MQSLVVYMNNMLMNLPLMLPAWIPGWVVLILALPVLLYVLAFLLMPFSVFGVKARIESLETQIDSLHEELRTMAMRASGILPPSSTELEPYEDVPNFGRLKKSQRGYEEPAVPVRAPVPTPVRPVVSSAPIPTPLATPIVPARERLTPAPPPPARATRRTEPRLD
jgi:hypothetical protein